MNVSIRMTVKRLSKVFRNVDVISSTASNDSVFHFSHPKHPLWVGGRAFSLSPLSITATLANFWAHVSRRGWIVLSSEDDVLLCKAAWASLWKDAFGWLHMPQRKPGPSVSPRGKLSHDRQELACRSKLTGDQIKHHKKTLQRLIYLTSRATLILDYIWSVVHFLWPKAVINGKFVKMEFEINIPFLNFICHWFVYQWADEDWVCASE